MCAFLAPQHAPKTPMPNLEQENPDVEIIDNLNSPEPAQKNSELASPMPDSEEIFSGYLSNLPGDDDNDDKECPNGGNMSHDEEDSEAEEDIPKFSA